MSYRALLVTLVLALGASCARHPAKPAVERIAVLRFENLGPDPSNDWMGRAFSEIVGAELEGAPGIYAISSGRLHGFDGTLGRRPLASPGISSERALALAAGANRIGYGGYLVRGNRLEVRLTLEDPRSLEVVREIDITAPADDVIGAASSLAEHISSRISKYSTHNAQAMKAYVTVLESPDPTTSEQTLRQAILADPNFSPAYRDLAQFKLRQQDRSGALAVLGEALARGNALGPAERARVELDLAALRGDAAARERALAALAAANPTDPVIWRDLGLSQMARHQYPQAAQAFRDSLRIEPDDVDILNQFGYAAAYAGNADEAARSLRRYQELQPTSPNPPDSLGDTNLIVGRLQQAEGFYLEGAKKSADFYNGIDYFKAAMARLMTGDVAGADTLAKRYFDARSAAHDPLLEYRKAQWSWLSGRHKTGYQEMEKVARDSESGPLREVAAHAYTELTVWSLLLGNREAATAMSQKSIALATPSSAAAAAVARLLTQPAATPAEWAARAEQLAPGANQAAFRNLAQAYALLLAKNYQAAAPFLQQIYDSGQGTDEGVPILLAWACLESGRVADAAALLRFYPIPPTSGPGPFTALYFPRFFYLRAAVAEKQGKTAEARDNLAVFDKLAGADALTQH